MLCSMRCCRLTLLHFGRGRLRRHILSLALGGGTVGRWSALSSTRRLQSWLLLHATPDADLPISLSASRH